MSRIWSAKIPTALDEAARSKLAATGQTINAYLQELIMRDNSNLPAKPPPPKPPKPGFSMPEEKPSHLIECLFNDLKKDARTRITDHQLTKSYQQLGQKPARHRLGLMSFLLEVLTKREKNQENPADKTLPRADDSAWRWLRDLKREEQGLPPATEEDDNDE